MARPQLEIDESLVEKLASIGCTMKEIASVAGCSVDTLERRFADTIKRGQDKGRTSLRRFQWKAAEAGNVTMLIWLGKQLLGQSDKAEHESATPISTAPIIISPEVIADIIKKARGEA